MRQRQLSSKPVSRKKGTMNPAEEGRFDDVLLPMLSYLGKMDSFLEHIFNFLHRRTDFYRIMKSETDTMGFMPGVSEKLVRNYYMKYEKMARNEQSSQVTRQVGTEDSQKAEPGPVRSAGKAADTAQPASNCPGAVAAGKPATSVTSHAAATATSSQASHTFVDTSDSYNGDVTDRFSWSQTTTDVDIKVPLPAGVNTSQLCVSIQATHIRVAVKTSGGEDVLLDGELSERIRPSECMWTKDGSKLVLSLEKCKDYMWKTVFIGDKEIDLNAIDNTRHLTDYDDETQTGVRKAMYDQEQRMKGLPTSDEQKTLSALEGAWNAEGSPFKGTPFDPSTINLSGSSLGGLPSQDPA